MYSLIPVLIGFLASLSVYQNGRVGNLYGSYSGAVITHFVGLVAISIFTMITHKKLPRKKQAAPWMFIGGAIGAANVVLKTLAFGKISVTAITGLGLLGQSITSLMFDQFGFLGARKNPFFKGKLIGLAAVFAGAMVMVLPLNGASPVNVILAMCSGFTLVTARTINSRLTEKHGIVRANWMNYMTGFLAAILMVAVFGRQEKMFTDFQWDPNILIYFGGLTGLVIVTFQNIVVNKISALKMTLLRFVGQIFSSLLLDFIMQGSFSVKSAVGGVLVTIGLFSNIILEHRRNQHQKEGLSV